MPVESATHSTVTDVTYTFSHLGAQWQGALVLAAAVVLMWWAWTRYGPAPSAPWGFIARCARVLGVALAVILLAGPAKQTVETVRIPGRTLIAVDASMSMAIADYSTSATSATSAARIAIAQELFNALERSPLRPEWRLIGGLNGPFAPGITASGASSPLGEELDRLVGERRPDLLIALSDFRTTDGPTPARIGAEWLRTKSMRVMALVVGSERIDPELRIEDVGVNRLPALDEQEQVRVRIATRGSTTPVIVEAFVDGVSVSKTEVIPLGNGDESVAFDQSTADLKVPFTKAGSATMSIVVRSGHLEQRSDIPVRVAAKPLKVLLLAHRPSSEMRFLREALRRDKTITVHAYLADGKWRRWSQGSEQEAGPINLPVDGNIAAQYDVIVIYDIGPDAPLLPNHMQGISDAVTKQGSGLIWVAGQVGNLVGFKDTVAGALMPVEIIDRSAVRSGFLADTPFQLRRTAEAEAQGLLDPGVIPWEKLADLRGAWPLTKSAIKPGAEVLAENLAGVPLVVTRVFGEGRSIFVAMDDTWRWRKGAGDVYLHRFYSQLLRFAAGGRKTDQRGWRLEMLPRRVSQGDMVSAVLTPTGRQEAKAPQVAIRLNGPGGERVITLMRQGSGYAGRFPAPVAGQWIANTLGEVAAEAADLLVTPPAGEIRDPRRDVASAKAFAEASGGSLHFSIADLLAALPKDLDRPTQSPPLIEGMWDTWWAFALLITLFAIDWAIRRWQRLP